MDPEERAKLKQELFGRHLEVLNIDGDREGDQLTAELRDFVDCIRTGRTPRVTGEDGRDALALAEWILECVRSHHWEGSTLGATGPNQMPKPAGKLFDSPKTKKNEAA